MSVCTHCLQSERDCDCALELDYALVLQALGIDRPATLFDVAQADRMDAQYKLAVTLRAERELHHTGYLLNEGR